MGVRETVLSNISINVEKSELKIGNEVFAFHCDKFNTRILKGLEDTLGFEKARELLFKSSEKTTLGVLKGLGDILVGATVQEKLSSIFELYKVLGHGNIKVTEFGDTKSKVISDPSYMAEGWIENQEKWNWSRREKPICHDQCGAIAAAFELAFGKNPGQVKVVETTCHSMGSAACEFDVEVL